jgi:hypothetical protein
MIFVYLLVARRAQVTRDSSGAALHQKVGAEAQVIRDGPRAAPSREREPEPRGHMATSELPSAGRREPLS